jgi:thiamine phosphate synthase YjbQ (UPF0047 family)
MHKNNFANLLLCAATLSAIHNPTPALADDSPIETIVTVDAGQTLRTFDPRRLGGTNIAMWYFPKVYASPQVRSWMSEMRPAEIRMPGGSWANGVYWNGNGVRDANGVVDPSKVGPDGYPAVDYSAYAPSFLVDSKTLHPADNNWHGHVDVKIQHEFIKDLPDVEAMTCPNAGTGRAIDAAEWVKWANQKMGYNVHVWEIGNELGGAWEAGSELPFGQGQLTAQMYTKRYNEMAAAMRKVDPTIKIGGGAFVEEMIRDCGEYVDFASIHTYPGSTTMTDAQMFTDMPKLVEREIGAVKKWIHQYQPQRENKIEIAYTEWNLGFSVDKSQMFAGLWSSIFLAELAKNGAHLAHQWDAFSDLLHIPEEGNYARKSEYYALWLWNNYMGDRLIPATSSHRAVYTAATRSNDALTVMLINTDRERDAKVNVQLSGFTPADTGEVARVTSREYHWNTQTRKPLWSNDPRIQTLKTGEAFEVTLSPYSMTYVRIPEKSKPGLSPMAQKAAGTVRSAEGAVELRFIMPSEAYVGDQVPGELIALAAGSSQPYQGSIAPATLTTDGSATLESDQVRLPEAVGHFSVKPTGAGEMTITAQSGDARAAHKLTVKPSIPRPVVFWDFSKPPVTDSQVFTSNFTLKEDLTQRANRAVARVDFPADGILPAEKKNELLKVDRMPGEQKLKQENIRGVIVDMMAAPSFASEDPNANVMVVMQSSANWWMVLGNIPLNDAKEWKTYQFEIKQEDHIKAMPAAHNVIFLLNTTKPVKGSIYFDKVGFMVR